MKKLALLLIGLAALCLGGCFAAVDDDGENVGEKRQALCASYPTSGAGDGDGTGTPTGGWTGFVTKLRVNPVYDFMIEVTQTKSVGGSTLVGNVNFGGALGSPNIKFLTALSPGWTGSLANKITAINVCQANLPPSMTGCGGNVCTGPNGYMCMFVNNALAFTWYSYHTPSNPGGSIIPNTTSFPNGVTGIWGTAPAEPSHFRIFYLSSGGPSSTSSRWSFVNSAICP